jgi:septum formation protein
MSDPADRGRAPVLPEIVLASTSTYRRALLDRLGLPFRCRPPRCDEDALKRLDLGACALAERLALEKATSLQAEEPDAVIIGCDQVATFEGQIFGKPETAERAVEQLCALAGRSHGLVTALAVIHQDRVFRHTDLTVLHMRDLSRAAIERYVAADCPLDCAGSYKFESRGIVFFDQIQTDDHTAITGLPLIALVTILRDLGFDLP